MNELQTIWGWQPALYLFLGGMGAGAFVTAAIMHLRTGAETVRIQNGAVWASVACLVVGLLLLVAELVFPLRGFLLWQSFSNFSSWMTYGAWILFAAVIVFGITGLFTSSIAGGFGARFVKPKEGDANVPTALLVAGIVLALAVAVYTGMLLSAAPGVPLWNSLLLPCLFTVSAIDTGVALVEIIGWRHADDTNLSDAVCHAIDKAVIVLVVLELVVLALYLGLALSGQGAASGSFAATAAASANTLVAGQLAWQFWLLVVLVGLLLPLVVAVRGLKKQHVGNTPLAGPLCALVGGCTLRFVILMAGAHIDTVGEFISGLML